MNKPNNYDNVQAAGDYTPIELGGHKLVIMQVEELTAAGGNPYIKVSFDTAKNDRQPDFYAASYKADTRSPKKWSGVTTVFVLDKDGNTDRRFKGFCTAVERSNPGFKIAWGDQFCASLKGKAVGGVFGEEDYENSYSEVKTARKLFWFRGIEGIEDVEIPKKRELKSQQNTPAPKFVDLEEVDDGEIPF